MGRCEEEGDGAVIEQRDRLKKRINHSTRARVRFRGSAGWAVAALLTVFISGVAHAAPYLVTNDCSSTAAPGGWSYTSITTTAGGESGAAFTLNAANDAVITPLLTRPGTLRFSYRRSANSTAWSLAIEQAATTSGSWSSVDSITSASTAWAQKTTDLSAFTNIYLRLRDTRGSGTVERYLDNIVVETREPTVHASSMSFSSVTKTNMTVSWTIGNGTGRLVLARSGAAPTGSPSDETTYTASPVYGSGSSIGDGYVVYAGEGSSVLVTGLNAGTTYHFKAFEMNYGTNSANAFTYNYYTGGTPLSGNQTTLADCSPSGSLTLVQQTAYYTNTWNDNGGTFDNGSTEMAMWANGGGAKQVVAWRNFRTDGSGGGDVREMQPGDRFRISVYGYSPYGILGVSINDGASTGNWANRHSNTRGYIQCGNSYGDLYVTSTNGTASWSGIRPWGTTVTIVFDILSSKEFTANIEGQTPKYDLTMLNAPGDSDRVDGFSLYYNDDWNGSGNQNAYWKQTTMVTNLTYVELGADNGTRDIVGKITDSTDAACTNSAVPNLLRKTGSGTVTLQNTANTYTRGTRVEGGTLAVFNDGSLGAAPGSAISTNIDIYSTGTLRATNTFTLSSNRGIWFGNSDGPAIEVDSGKTLTYAGVMGGDAAWNKKGAGILALTGASSTNNGKVSIQNGTLRISGDGSLGATPGSPAEKINIWNTGAFEADGTFTLNANRRIEVGTVNGPKVSVTSGNTLTYGGQISGSANWSKESAGILKLTGASTASGTLTVNGGQLIFNGTNTSQAVSVTSSTYLYGSGSVGALTISGQASAGEASNTVGNLRASSLTLPANGRLQVNLSAMTGTAGTDWDVVTVNGGAGTYTVSASVGNEFVIALKGNPAFSNTQGYTNIIVDAGTASGFAANKFTIDLTEFAPSLGGGTFSVDASGGDLRLIFTPAATPTPVITVLGTNGAVIALGDNTPSAADGTDFGSVYHPGTPSVTNVFSITNSGTAVLNITGVTTNSGMGAAGDFVVLSYPPSVSVGTRSNLLIAFNPTAAGVRTGAVVIASNDSSNSPYAFAVMGTGTSSAPAVSTTVASATNMTTATAGGNVTDDGGATVTMRGVVWGASANPTVGGAGQSTNGTGTGSFSGTLTNLTPGATYHYRAYAQNSVGTSYGTDYTLTTPCFSGVVGGLYASATNDVDFTATWNAFAGVAGYALDVSTSSVFEVSSLSSGLEVFTNISGTASSYLTRHWTNNGIGWTAYETRTDQTIDTTNSTVTLRDTANAYFISDPISGGVNEIRVTHQQKFSGSGGTFDIFVNSTKVATNIAISTSVQTAIVANIGVSGSFTLMITNSGAVRPAFANLTWTNSGTLAMYVPGYSNRAVAGTSQIVTGLTSGVTYYYRVRATNDYCATDNSATSSVTTVAIVPNVDVIGNGVVITNGDNSPALADFTDFGSVGLINSNLVRTYTITNSGAGTLLLGNVTVSGAHATNFIVAAQPSLSVASGAATTFQVRFDPSATGLRTATLQFTNNTPGKSPYSFDVQGVGVAAGMVRNPATIDVTGMVGSAPAAANFGVTNGGLGQLIYAVTTNAPWLTVSPVSKTLSEGESQQHSVSFGVTRYAAGVSNATITITDANASNSPQTIAVSLTLTNIPEVVSAAAVADGKELARLTWTKSPSFDVMVVHRATNAPTAPSNGTTYAVGDVVATNGSRVVYIGSGSYLDHVVRPGSTNYYAFYSINNDHYATGTVVSVAMPKYAANEQVEQFGYTNGVSLSGLNGGNLFNGAWSVGAGNFTVLSNGPTPNLYVNTNYPPSAGQRVVMSNYVNDTEMRASRSFTAVTNGAIYVSYLVGVEYGGAGKYTGVRLLSNGVERVFVGETGGSDLLGIDGHGNPLTNSSYNINSFQSDTGNVYLVVARYIFSSNQVAAKAYYRTDTVPQVEPTTWDVTGIAAADRIYVDGLELVSSGFSGNQPGLVSFDEIRVATTWSGVVPVYGTPEFSVLPTNIVVSVMRGSNPPDQAFTVTNSGGGILNYTIATNMSWATVSPNSGTLSAGSGESHSIQLTTAPLPLGTNLALVTLTDNNAVNSPAHVAVSVIVTNIPPPFDISTTADGNELVRLGWSVSPGLNTLVLHGNTDIATDPSQGVSYTNGDMIGSAQVIYRGSATQLEHVVPQGSTNYYAFYAMNSNYYSHFGTNVIVVDCPDPTATNLVAGDIAIYGMMTHTAGTNVSNDSFAFVTLRDIPTGTQIKFTDNGWAASNAFRASEGIITWTATSCVPAGTAVQWVFTNTPQVTQGLVTSNNNFALNVNAEQIIAYQGAEANPQFIFALSSHPDGVWQNDATNPNSSRLPTGLTNGHTAVVIQGLDNIVILTNLLEITGDRDAVLNYICDTNNWMGDDVIVWDLMGFDFTFPDLNTSGGGVMTNIVMGTYYSNEFLDVFAYTNSFAVGTNTHVGGQGWGGAWTNFRGAWTVLSNNNDEVSFPTMTLYPTNAANMVKAIDPGIDTTSQMSRAFTPFTNGSFYVGVMMGYQYAGNDKFAGVSLMQSGVEKGFIGKVSDPAYANTLGIDTYGGPKQFSSYSMNGLQANSNNTYLLIARYDFDTKQISGVAYYRTVYVPSNEPAYWAVTATVSGAGITSIDGIMLNVGADQGGDIGNVYFDEVRIARTWGELLNGRPPRVETRPITNITLISASGGGEAFIDPILGITNRGVIWSTNPIPLLANDPHTFDGAGGGLYSSALSNLIAGQTYYVQAYAQNSAGTGYGGISNFTVDCFSQVVSNLFVNPTNNFDFTLNWSPLAGAAGYQVDVSTNASFSSVTGDDFNDGDFTAAPAWAGNTASYEIATNATLPGGSAATDGNYLASTSSVGSSALTMPSSEVNSWSFSLGSPDFDPASANHFGVILMSDTALTGDITTGTWNGYYLRLGVDGGTDYLELWRSSGAVKTKIGNFSAVGNFGVGALTNGLNLQVSRDGGGVFSVLYDTGFTYASAPGNAGGSLTDATHSASSYFGVYTRFGNPAATRRVYIDNIQMGSSGSYVPGYNSRFTPVTSVSVTGLVEGATYFYTVRGVGGGVCVSANSPTGSVTTRDFSGPSITNFGVNGVTNTTITDYQLANAITVTATAVDTGGVNWNGNSMTAPNISPFFSIYDSLGAQILAPQPFSHTGHVDGESPAFLSATVTVSTVTTGVGFRVEITVADNSMTNTSVRTNLFTVVDDDKDPPTPQGADFNYGGVASRYFSVTTNSTPALIANRGGSFSNVIYTLTDAELNESYARDLRFAFGVRDAYSGLARGAVGNTNTVMSFSIGDIISGNFTNYRADLSSSNYTNARTTNVWAFSPGFFTEMIITSLMANASNVVTVTVPDDDNDRTNDQALLVSNPIGSIAVIDDDVVPPVLNKLTIGSATVTNDENAADGGLIISQYYEGSSNNKWIELYNASPNSIDLTSGVYRVGLWSNADRESWKTGSVPNASAPLTGVVAPGATFVIRHGSATLPGYANADQTNSFVIAFNGDDSVVIYRGATYSFTNVVDAIGFTGNDGQDASFVRNASIVFGTNVDYNASDWVSYTPAQVDSASANTPEYIGYHSTAGGGGNAISILTDGDVVSGTYVLTAVVQDVYSGVAVTNPFAPYYVLRNTNNTMMASNVFITAFTNGSTGERTLAASPGPALSTNYVTLGTNSYLAMAWDADNDRSNDRVLGTSAPAVFYVVDDDIEGPTLPGTKLHDPFNDGSRSDGADPQDVNWWALGTTLSLGTTNDAIKLGDGTALTLRPGTNSGVVVGSVTNGLLSLVNVGEEIVLTFKMRFVTAQDRDNAFGFGFYYNNDTAVTGDQHTAAAADDQGYLVRMGTGANTGFRVDREAGTNGAIVAGTDLALITNSAAYNVDETTTHTFELHLTKESTGVVVDVIADGVGLARLPTVDLPLLTNVNEVAFFIESNTVAYLDDISLAKSAVLVVPNVWTNSTEFHIEWTTNDVVDKSGVGQFRLTTDGVQPTSPTNGVNAGFASGVLLTVTNEGITTNFFFGVDADGDRPGDQSMGGAARFITKLDRTAPPRVTGMSATNGPDDTAEIYLSWSGPSANAGNRQSDNAPLSPWRTYAIFYTDQPTGPTTNDAFITYLNGPLSLRTNITTDATISNFISGADYRLAVAGIDEAGNIGALSDTVIVSVANFIVTQGVVSAFASNVVEVSWTAKTNEFGVVTRVFDTIYFDSRDGFANTTTNLWQLLQRVTNSWAGDTGSVARTPPYILTSTMRFYRAAVVDAWRASNVTRRASQQVYVTKALRLVSGENWYSLFAIPDSNTVASVFGTNRLPASGVISNAARITWYSGGTTSGMPTKSVYLSASNHWIYSLGGVGIADHMAVPINEGFNIELPTTVSTQNLIIIGQVPTNTLTQSVTAGGVFNVLSYTLPRRVRVQDLLLKESGFRAGTNEIDMVVKGLADELRVLNNANGNGSMTTPRLKIWFQKVGSATGNFYRVGSGIANNLYIEPEETIIWLHRGAAPTAWTNDPLRFYSTPSKNVSP